MVAKLREEFDRLLEGYRNAKERDNALRTVDSSQVVDIAASRLANFIEKHADIFRIGVSAADILRRFPPDVTEST